MPIFAKYLGLTGFSLDVTNFKQMHVYEYIVIWLMKPLKTRVNQ